MSRRVRFRDDESGGMIENSREKYKQKVRKKNWTCNTMPIIDPM